MEEIQGEAAEDGGKGNGLENFDQVVEGGVFPDAAVQVGCGEYEDLDPDDDRKDLPCLGGRKPRGVEVVVQQQRQYVGAEDDDDIK